MYHNKVLQACQNYYIYFPHLKMQHISTLDPEQRFPQLLTSRWSVSLLSEIVIEKATIHWVQGVRSHVRQQFEPCDGTEEEETTITASVAQHTSGA